MQEPKTDKDDEYEKKINEHIANPPMEDMMMEDEEGAPSSPSREEQTSNPVQLDQLTSIIRGLQPGTSTQPTQQQQPSQPSQSSSQPSSSSTNEEQSGTLKPPTPYTNTTILYVSTLQPPSCNC